MRFSILLPACAVFLGCASTEKYKAMVDSFVGKPGSELIKQIGPPEDRKLLPNASSELTYSRTHFRENIVRDRTFEKSTEPLFKLGDSGIGIGSVDTYKTTPEIIQSNNYHCTTTFIEDTNGIIISVSFFGNSCTAK